MPTKLFTASPYIRLSFEEYFRADLSRSKSISAKMKRSNMLPKNKEYISSRENFVVDFDLGVKAKTGEKQQHGNTRIY